jgi:hypothetical protein
MRRMPYSGSPVCRRRPEGLLLDALADQVELGPGEGDNMERIMPISA